MINPFVIKKYMAVILPCAISTVAFFLGLINYGYWVALGIWAGGVIISLFIAFLLLDNPFRAVLEGKGILALDLTSTGIIRPFLLRLQPPMMQGKVGGNPVMDIFNRGASFILKPPVVRKENTATPITSGEKAGGVKLEFSEEEMNRNRFQLYHFPVFIYNSMLKSMLTKDFISEKEKDAFSEHTVLYLIKIIEGLTSITRDFARHVIEQLRPTISIFANKWFWIILLVVGGILAFLFGPAIIETIGGTISTATSSMEGTLNPR